MAKLWRIDEVRVNVYCWHSTTMSRMLHTPGNDKACLPLVHMQTLTTVYAESINHSSSSWIPAAWDCSLTETPTEGSTLKFWLQALRIQMCATVPSCKIFEMPMVWNWLRVKSICCSFNINKIVTEKFYFKAIIWCMYCHNLHSFWVDLTGMTGNEETTGTHIEKLGLGGMCTHWWRWTRGPES